jgi:hypothetical protein
MATPRAQDRIFGIKDRLSTPQAMRTINGWFTVFWVVMVPISYVAGWLDSVVYVSALSLWALVSGHWAAWQAARVEVRQDLDNDVADVIDELERVQDRLRRLQTSFDHANGHATKGHGRSAG